MVYGEGGYGVGPQEGKKRKKEKEKICSTPPEKFDNDKNSFP